jgi:NAD(P)-dependent dehydrogenase (short-subunit alcohol dehydrogenase family)
MGYGWRAALWKTGMTKLEAGSSRILQVAFVTGSAQGIGLATVERLARDGFKVVAMDRNAEQVTRAMAMELRERQIAVNSVAPGFTDTPMTRSAPSAMFAAWEALEPGCKAATPDLIANAIAFFASPSTQFITGQTLFVDGGKSLGGLGI